MPLPSARFAALSRSIGEYFTQGLYDSVNYAAAGQAVMTFFAVPLGQAAVLTTAVGGAPAAGTVKTYRDTNMEVAGFVPDKAYQFSGMSVYFRRITDLVTDELDRKLVIGNTWWHFRIGDKDVLYVPSAFVPIINNSLATTWGATRVDAGPMAPMYGFPTPLTILPGQVIRVTMEAGGAVPVTTTFDVQLMLHADMGRAV